MPFGVGDEKVLRLADACDVKVVSADWNSVLSPVAHARRFSQT